MGTRMTRPSDAPVATLVNYACHGTIMGPANRLITPDYAGAMKRVVEEAVGGRCLFLLGSAGNQGPVQGFQADTSVYRQLGAVLGHEFATRPALPLRIMDREIVVPLREGLPEKRAATEKLDVRKARLKAAREKNDEAAITEATYMARRADIQLRMADDFGGKTSAGVRAHFITFGDVALVGCNLEPFCEIGMAIKRQSPFPATFMCGYTNGRMAYLPTADEWTNGGYEVENSPFGQNAAEVLQKEI